MRYFWSAILLGLVFCGSARSSFAACNQAAGNSVAKTMNSQLATLVGFTMVACTASEDTGKCSILCITTSQETDANVNVLLVPITASAAVNMRKVGMSNFARLGFADKNLLLRRHYLATTAAKADRFQKAVSQSSNTPQQSMAMVRREYNEVAIPERKE